MRPQVEKNVETADSKMNKKISKPGRKQYQLRAHIYMARNLPALDSSGLSDPYLVIRFRGLILASRVSSASHDGLLLTGQSGR